MEEYELLFQRLRNEKNSSLWNDLNMTPHLIDDEPRKTLVQKLDLLNKSKKEFDKCVAHNDEQNKIKSYSVAIKKYIRDINGILDALGWA